jgi:hypothetical protein
MPGAQLETCVRILPLYVMGVATSGNSKSTPHFTLVLPVDLDCIVCGGRPAIAASLGDLIVVNTGVDDYAMALQGQLKAEYICMGMPGYIVRTDLTEITDNVISLIVSPTVVSSIWKGEALQ